MNRGALDGNAAAGVLADVFAFEATTAVTTCAACHHTSPIAMLDTYLNAPGAVLRCSSCGAVQIRLVRAPRRAWLDLSGVDMMTIADLDANIATSDDTARGRVVEVTR